MDASHYYYARMCAYMGNTVYAIRCVCLCIMVGAGHTGFGQFRSKSNKKTLSEANTALKKEKHHALWAGCDYHFSLSYPEIIVPLWLRIIFGDEDERVRHISSAI